MVEFEPRIVGFLCNWCGYAGADLAGVSRIQYPPNIRIIRVMCSGRVDPVIVLEMFANGADGVMVVGCHPPSDCHYVWGNLYAERKMKMLKKLIELAGLEPDRLRLDWVSAAEGLRFANIVNEFTNQIRRLGPSPLSKPDEQILLGMRAAIMAASGSRLRTLVGRELKITRDRNVYGEKIPQEDFDRLLEEAVFEEYLRSRIFLLAKKKPTTVELLAKHLGVDPALVLRNIVVMRRKGLLAMGTIEADTPVYVALEGRR
jgi:coenzyme F420-reducing hydrogenase delta subunit